MPKPSRLVTYRLRARPGEKQKYRVVIQRRRWLIWNDWFPVDNAVRSLQQEFIDHYDRMQEILEELKDAEAYVNSAYQQIQLGDMRKGTGAPFKDEIRAQETLKPDVSERFKTVRDLVQQGQGRQRPGGGTRTMFIGQTGNRFDPSSINREAIGDEFNADHVMQYRSHRPENKQHNDKGQQKNQPPNQK